MWDGSESDKMRDNIIDGIVSRSSGFLIPFTIVLKESAIFTYGSLIRFFSKAILKNPALIAWWVVTKSDAFVINLLNAIFQYPVFLFSINSLPTTFYMKIRRIVPFSLFFTYNRLNMFSSISFWFNTASHQPEYGHQPSKGEVSLLPLPHGLRKEAFHRIRFPS